MYSSYTITSIFLSIRTLTKKFPNLSKIQATSIKKFSVLILFLAISLIIIQIFNGSKIINQNLTNLLTSLPQLIINLFPIIFLREFTKKLFPEHYSALSLNKESGTLFKKYKISNREKEIIELICQGKSNKQIEDELFISIRTVKDHIYNIYKKAGVRNRVQLSNLFRSFHNQL